MVSKVKKSNVNYKGKTVSIGIDMHKISWRVTALVEGDIALAITLAKPNYDAFKKIISRFKGNHVRIVYEAGRKAEIGSKPTRKTVTNWPDFLRAACSKKYGFFPQRKGLIVN